VKITSNQIALKSIVFAASNYLTMIRELDQYYFQKEEPARSCLIALRALILKQDQQITETRKYGMPCFCYHKKMFCYLWTDKQTDEPYLLLVDGNQLVHPALETGNRSRMKILRVDAEKDLPVATIEAILEEALALRR
jgi:deoxyinosine 3'endonuclease (endonuclease V)